MIKIFKTDVEVLSFNAPKGDKAVLITYPAGKGIPYQVIHYSSHGRYYYRYENSTGLRFEEVCDH